MRLDRLTRLAIVLLALGGCSQRQSVILEVGSILWRIHRDGRIERLEYDFPGRGESRLHFGTTSPVVSPDQQSAAFVRDYDLWILDVRGDSAVQHTQLGTAANAQCAAVYPLVTQWSADSRQLLYYLTHGETEDPEGF